MIIQVEGRKVEATASTDHAMSSYGIPVLVIDGIAHGPGDLPRRTRFLSGSVDERAAFDAWLFNYRLEV